MTSGKIGMAGLMLCIGLAGCQKKDVILEGTRFAVRAPLEDSVAVEGEAAPVAPASEPLNTSVPIALPGAAANADWGHRGGNARHAAGNSALSANPQRVFSTNIGAGASKRARIAASPVVAGGRVFTMDATARITAVSTGGAALWTANITPDSGEGSKVVGGGLAAAGNRVYATSGYGELVALDASTGGIVWRQRFDSPLTGAPTVAGNVVYAMGRDGSAMAVSADTGKQVWQQPGAPNASGMIGTASVAVGDNEAVLPFASGQISAVQAATGDPIWNAGVSGQRLGRSYGAMGDVTGDPVIVGDTVYLGTAAGRTVAINMTTGGRIWTANEGALNPPLVVGGSVFVVNDEARLVRLDAGTGEVIWSVEMPYFVKDKPKKRRAIYAHYGPVLAGGRIVVASSDGSLRGFDPTNGNLVYSVEIPGGAASAPALAQGLLFVVGGNGQLHAFR
ncbi:MAG: PQQ-binding-like beta-propeller repeat protein [Cypionkella sp.]|uniref:outer membrane protein assembly factor BamB family protein n=1 Tax=Cypionkella sp. TaxID=2811411 RepID=UPI002ABCC51B|nr:PQQ-binding-like beta-propeller repeat protein [Cypionkella sp.]MDZ4312149.1 PQQ-binding-like beta-propeller repeat protein [Cypionkella sp.]